MSTVVTGQLIERHLTETTLDQNDTIETTLDRIMKEKIYNFVNFCLKNIVVSKKIDFLF